MPKAGSYYYEQLNKEQQRAYYAIKDGLLKMQDSFAVPKLSGKELSDIYFMIRMDCPEIFYSVTFSYRYYADSTAVEMVPQYLFTKDKMIVEKRFHNPANIFLEVFLVLLSPTKNSSFILHKFFPCILPHV